MPRTEATQQLLDWLAQRRDAVMAAQGEALNDLEAGHVDSYLQKIRRKAELLADLADEAEPLLQDVPQALAEEVEATLANYSGNARMALKLNSQFFMSALLYADDASHADPDNFSLFIARLEREN